MHFAEIYILFLKVEVSEVGIAGKKKAILAEIPLTTVTSDWLPRWLHIFIQMEQNTLNSQIAASFSLVHPVTV